MTIKIARHAVDMALRSYTRGSGPMFMTTHLEFHGFRISVGLWAEIVDEPTPTSFMGLGDFTQASIRIYRGDNDVTNDLFGHDEIKNATAETLFDVMQVLKQQPVAAPEVQAG